MGLASQGPWWEGRDWGEGSPGGLRGQSSGESFQNDRNRLEWFGNVFWGVEISENGGKSSELLNWKIQRRLRGLFPSLTPPRDPKNPHEDQGREVLAGQSSRGFPVPNSPGKQKIGCPGTF